MKKQISRRQTKQRNALLEELSKLNSHPTADFLFKMVRRRIPNISFGTVYRNLNLLRNEGEILELVSGKYSCRYDAETRNHYHFFCLKCQKVFDLDEPVLKDLDRKVSKRAGMEIKYHRIDFYGYCRNCKG